MFQRLPTDLNAPLLEPSPVPEVHSQDTLTLKIAESTTSVWKELPENTDAPLELSSRSETRKEAACAKTPKTFPAGKLNFIPPKKCIFKEKNRVSGERL